MSKRVDHVYHFDQVAIGHSFQAMSYCYRAKLPLILNRNDRFNHFAVASSDAVFKHLPYHGERETLTCFAKGEKKPFQTSARLMPAWTKCLQIMSIAGKMPFLGKVSSITVEDEENLLKVITLEGRLIKATYNTLFVFDDRNVKFRSILPYGINRKEKHYRIMDWGRTTSGSTHDIDLMYKLGDEDYGDIALRFYPRKSNSNNRDFVAMFKLKEKLAYNKDYSMVLTRFKLMDFFEENDFPTNKVSKGRVNIEMMHRQKTPDWKNLYGNTACVKFIYGDAPWLNKSDPVFAKLEDLLG